METMFQRAGGWWKARTYADGEWVREEQVEFSVYLAVVPALRERI